MAYYSGDCTEHWSCGKQQRFDNDHGDAGDSNDDVEDCGGGDYNGIYIAANSVFKNNLEIFIIHMWMFWLHISYVCVSVEARRCQMVWNRSSKQL